MISLPKLALALTTLAANSVRAHDEGPITPEKLRVYSDLQAAAYHCAPAVAVFEAQRKRAFAQKVLGSNGAAEYGLGPGNLVAGDLFGDGSFSENGAERPEGQKLLSCAPAEGMKIRNNTCVLAPEVTSGPYHEKGEHLVRNNIAEYQPGLLSIFNIGVIDVETCEPVPNVLVDIWQANATGHYASHPEPAADLRDEVPAKEGKRKGLLSPFPKTKFDETFLRGAWPTDDKGVASFTSIFPGYYTGRATHVHVKVHPEWEVQTNGSFIPSRLVHIGQFFFDDEINSQVDKLWPYNLNPIADIRGRTRNWDDSLNIFEDSQVGGYKSLFDTYLLGGVLQQGVVGYITMAVNMSASYPDSWSINPEPKA